jgi:hypothetical protein
MKISMIRKYEGGKILSAIARELRFAVPTVNSVVKDAIYIEEYVKER